MDQLDSLLRQYADPKRAELSQRYFKTGKGEYAEGDVFVGVAVPDQRKIARAVGNDLSMREIKLLLNSKIHEKRLIALFVLVERYRMAKREETVTNRRRLFNFYLQNSGRIDNWDLVDSSAPYIVGDFLLDKNPFLLYSFAKSQNMWKRRISIISTLAFVKAGKLGDPLRISALLLEDRLDLIHKAVGWVLREVGKKNLPRLEEFIRDHYGSIPRTTLRYAIERFPERKRLAYLNGSFDRDSRN
jgi:3-methyladenine DNA glycosylase AlkD